MAVVSRPVAAFAFVACAVGIYLWATPETVAAKTPPKPRKKAVKAADAGWDFPRNAFVRFAKPEGMPRDVFLPAVQVQRVVKLPEPGEDQVQIPASYADGEGGWAYTGMAEVDGVRMALLENGGTKQAGYVREGDDWKKSHIVGITTACIVLSNEKGVAETVYRFNPNTPPKPKPLPEPGFRPLNPGPNPVGPIGANVQIRPIPSFPTR
jgi:hypothetical protein